jgi:hypothetical protein
MILVNQFFGSNSDSSIPVALELKANNFTDLLLVLVLFTFALIAFSKLQNIHIFKGLYRLFLSNKNVVQTLKEEMRINSLGSIALLFNYFIVSSICTFLALFYATSGELNTILSIAILTPLGLFSLQILGMWIIGLITRETKIMIGPSLHTLLLREFFGLFLFFLSLLWILNPSEHYYFTHIFLGLVCLELLLWNAKSTVLVLKSGVSWYYIILYLCTLEILPLFITYILLVENFKF